MNNKTVFRKAKNSYIYDLKGNKYLDLRKNSNILGYSNKHITNIIKNHISNGWNIDGDTIFHRRFIKFIEKNISDKYDIYFNYSLEEFLFRFHNYIQKKENKAMSISGSNFTKYCNNLALNISENNNTDVKIYDMTEIYLNNNVYYKESHFSVLNYYWYPDLKFELYDSEIIILPSIYSGNFNNVFVLIKKDCNIDSSFSNCIYSIPSIYLVSSMRYYYSIKREMLGKISIHDFKTNLIKQMSRVFIFNDNTGLILKAGKLKNVGILINDIAPFYNYLPIILEDFQKKYLNGVKFDD